VNNFTYDFDRFTPSTQREEERRFQLQEVLQPLEAKLLQRANIEAADTILDIGCGIGRTSLAMAMSNPHAKTIGIDSSAEIINRARSLNSSATNVYFQVGNVEALDLPDNYSDLVFTRLLFQHLSRPLTALQEIYRVLKPGGRICILDTDDRWFSLYPEPASFSQLSQTMATWQQSQGGDSCVGRKLGYYLQQAKFTNINVTVETISSDVYGLETMLNWLSFGSPYLNLSPEIAAISETARQDTFNLFNLPYAWAGLGLFMVIGSKMGRVMGNE
jgi:ubiquinone/menaquinone biosynthesis C-methylase UbiE